MNLYIIHYPDEGPAVLEAAASYHRMGRQVPQSDLDRYNELYETYVESERAVEKYAAHIESSCPYVHNPVFIERPPSTLDNLLKQYYSPVVEMLLNEGTLLDPKVHRD